MPTDIEISGARDSTLQKIGRNLVDFQKMEVMLKFLLKVAGATVTASTSREYFEARAKLHETMPMGHLVELAAKALHGDAPVVPNTVREASITHSISLGDESQMKTWRNEFRRIVRERNSLVHRMVVKWNQNSIESCRSLCAELDAQRERVLPAYRHLESVVAAVRESHEELARNAEAIVASAFSDRSNGA